MHLALRALLLAALLPATVGPLSAQSGTFGSSVVVGADELMVAEPTTYFRPGTVYVYRRGAGGWTESAQLRAPAAARADGFGTALAATAGALFVAQRGVGVHVYERAAASWRHAATIAADGFTGGETSCDQYGYCSADFGIALGASGDWLLMGQAGRAPQAGGRRPVAASASTAGVVYAFQRGADGRWEERARLRPADGTPGDGFGAAIALSGDRALIGAPYHAPAEDTTARTGRVYEFVLEQGGWREAARVGARTERHGAFGASIALADDVAVVGAPGGDDGHGAAYVFRRDPASGVWTEDSRLAAFHGVRGDRFGSAVALAGTDVWVGAPSPRDIANGSVYAYGGSAAAPLLESTRRIAVDDPDTRDAFGDRIVARGDVVAVTATGMDHQAGTVFVYERGATGEWSAAATLVSAPDGLQALTGAERRCEDGKVGPFDCSDVDLLAFIPTAQLRAPEHARGVRTNDHWGWTDPETKREYALIGRNDGTSFIDVTDPTNPVLIGDLPKTPHTPPSQLWRDIKTYANHAFIVADGAGEHGMQVFDLRRLRNVRNAPVVFEPDVHYTRVASVHNIAINEETGYAYLVGARDGGETCGGGLHMIDIREPKNPQFAGCFRDQSGTHDVQCLIYRGPDARYRERELCLMSNGSMFAIADVTDKQNPTALARGASPNAGYIHQGWVTEDHRWFLQDDEADVIQGSVPTTRTLVWDLSDVEDPVLAQQFMGSLPASAHNLYVKGRYAYQANYRYGLHVLDVSDPQNPREVGMFDTAPFLEGPGFSGAWSTYPFFESGTVIVTSLQEGTFLLKPRPRVPVF